ncbi:helix-turn-helix domain-containing protein [Sedimenticola selenatireducens]|jgi:transcriptional regulator with XRE-family HTH domain|uniref:Helix-turn-helix transcriptional regulator n=1 Tax=Sedimenticola selenatireducens TaxID=191960 RepID=A0A557SLU8_9GAMM|nr:helix-turn-helix transcriptional regulator [Sedimenticola selenatireducens]TVO78330.1 helix-turn-helix transcriptional regulator [Sedimenticola selenatireducens]TVT62812.1 MAG: helix-turn-helix transcriptional regulator [Sedimenticola selenatireducens]
MSQTIQLIDTLKKVLKAHGKTYADVSSHLGLSEASVKRLFSDKSFSLQRLDQICQLIDLEISDLVKQMEAEAKAPITSLTIEQERELAADVELLLIAVCALNRWTYQQMVSYYQLSETRCIQHLARLDRLKLIELLPKNRIKLLVATNFKWREDGPIQRFYQEKLEADFFSSRFVKEHERLIVINGMLATSSNAVFQRKLEQLVREFDELNQDDAQLPFDQRYGTTVVLALRRWQYGLFESFRKKPK